ncbi:hypothetical protein L6164_010682 [Bauhinia variegata]|uniref:Uncharacterized protein n=1 Tax=Bauhinia variegata TaxID=167791 RepID=A0ACB9PNM2_BAUVA|nr:hypothetical protein L6164_010682 [Bauhinia variegata]
MDLKGLLLLALLVFEFSSLAYGNLVFPVEHKFKGRQRTLSAMKAHDDRRRARILSALDLSLGGNGRPSKTGLYYTKIQLGSPPMDYYVQVDTGSDILWVNCVQCKTCPQKSSLKIELILYDPKSSNTSHLVSCNDDFCTSTYNGPVNGCKPGMGCEFSVVYGDGSGTAGYFVRDYLTFDQVNGNLQTTPGNSNVIFGCGASHSGGLSSSDDDDALGGIIGFGQANSSVLSQLAAAGKAKRIFSHCLDTHRGGGIFAIGEVDEPKVKKSPLVANQAHYNLFLKDIEVDKDFLDLPTSIFDFGTGQRAIIDSGTTLAYLPSSVYEQLMSKVFSRQPGLETHTRNDHIICFDYDGNVDNGFPTVKFHFKESATLTVYPHDYLFEFDNEWCVGWLRTTSQSKDGREMTLLGDLVLSNRLFVYDLENMSIGWTDYNCSSSIKVKDRESVYKVSAHDISLACAVLIGRILSFIFLLVAMLA